MLSYVDYFKGMQEKYGKPNKPYFVPWAKGTFGLYQVKENNRPGLSIHHFAEYIYPDLSKKPSAVKNDMVWQQPEHLCYCDRIEHLILHLLIAIEFRREKSEVVLGLLKDNAVKNIAAWDSRWDIVNELFDKLNELKKGDVVWE